MSQSVDTRLLAAGLGGVGPTTPRTTGTPATGTASKGASFADALKGASGGLTFSGHATQRLQARNIDLGPTELQRLGDGVQRADSKGSRNAVVLMDGNAFVVSVANRTVITAVDSGSMKDHVFTNIDSAVIA